MRLFKSFIVPLVILTALIFQIGSFAQPSQKKEIANKGIYFDIAQQITREPNKKTTIYVIAANLDKKSRRLTKVQITDSKTEKTIIDENVNRELKHLNIDNLSIEESKKALKEAYGLKKPTIDHDKLEKVLEKAANKVLVLKYSINIDDSNKELQIVASFEANDSINYTLEENITASILPSIPNMKSRGWFTGDAHIHTAFSHDSPGASISDYANWAKAMVIIGCI